MGYKSSCAALLTAITANSSHSTSSLTAMDTASRVWLPLMTLLSSTIATAVEVLQIPQQHRVYITQNTSEILKFKITAADLENISILYGVNGTSKSFNPEPFSFDDTSLYSAIVSDCSEGSPGECEELLLRVEGDCQLNNTSFHLVLLEILPPSIRPVDVSHNFTVFISAAEDQLQPATTTAAATSSSINPTSSPPANTESLTTTLASDTTPPSLSPTRTGSHHQRDTSQLVFIFVLVVVASLLLLSASLHVLQCWLARKKKRRQDDLSP